MKLFANVLIALSVLLVGSANVYADSSSCERDIRSLERRIRTAERRVDRQIRKVSRTEDKVIRKYEQYERKLDRIRDKEEDAKAQRTFGLGECLLGVLLGNATYESCAAEVANAERKLQKYTFQRRAYQASYERIVARYQSKVDSEQGKLTNVEATLQQALDNLAQRELECRA